MAVRYERGDRQFQGTFSDMWFVTETALNFANAATGSGTFATADLTVPGVALGDMVLGLSMGVDTVDAAIVGNVTKYTHTYRYIYIYSATTSLI